MHEIYFVTKNRNKLNEVKEILKINLKHAPLEITEIQANTLEEIARDKVKKAFAHIKKPCFVEDVSFEIDALGGFPGPYIKWLGKSFGEKNIPALLINQKNRKALARAIIAFHDGKDIYTFEGLLKGKIAEKSSGEEGFGFDQVFIPENYEKTLSTLGQNIKNKISHRKKALDIFKEALKN